MYPAAWSRGKDSASMVRTAVQNFSTIFAHPSESVIADLLNFYGTVNGIEISESSVAKAIVIVMNYLLNGFVK